MRNTLALASENALLRREVFVDLRAINGDYIDRVTEEFAARLVREGWAESVTRGGRLRYIRMTTRIDGIKELLHRHTNSLQTWARGRVLGRKLESEVKHQNVSAYRR